MLKRTGRLTLVFILGAGAAQAAAQGQSPLIRRAQSLIADISAMEAHPVLKGGDQRTLAAYGKLFNGLTAASVDIEKNNPGDPYNPLQVAVPDALSVKSLNALDPKSRREALERLRLALEVRLGATLYHPRRVRIGRETYIVHNAWFHPAQRYGAAGISRLFDTLKAKGVFKLYTDPSTGLVRTSETSDTLMLRQWFTDGSENGMMQRPTDPESWKKVVIVHAAVLNTPEALNAVKNTVENPEWFRRISKDPALQKIDVKRGIYHIFDPNSIHFDSKTGAPVLADIRGDKDFNRKRVESFGLLLNDFVRTFKAGLIPGPDGKTKPWGFSPSFLDSGEPFRLIKTATVNVARFLAAINTNPKTGPFDMAAPSNSSWEEAPFPGGMTSDTGDAVVAFESLRDLMFNPAYDGIPAVRRLRQELAQTPGGALLKDKAKIDGFIDAGRRLVDSRVVQPLAAGKMPRQSLARGPDTSLLLLDASPYEFVPKNPEQDARIRLELVDAMKKALMGDDGMRRYDQFTLDGVPLYDSYLNDDFYLPTSLRAALVGRGSKSQDQGARDTSAVGAMKERQELSSPQFAAQWCLGESAALQALSRAKEELLQAIEQRGKAAPAEISLLARLDRESDDFINRNAALISGDLNPGVPVIRSDGTPAPGNSVMEAYEVVRDLKDRPRWVPGAHTLAWGASQLFDGLRRALKAQELEEALRARKLLPDAVAVR